MHRRRLLAVLGAVSAAGCYQTSDPPGGHPPDADFGVTFERSADGDTVILAHAGGQTVSSANIRVSIDETRVYEDGEILAGYDEGAESRNEWAETVRPGDRLVLSNGEFLPPWRTLSLETRSEGGAFIGGRREETPGAAMEIDVTGTQIEDSVYTTITHVQGDTFEAEEITVSVNGVKMFRGETLRDVVDGPATIDEWEDGIEPGDRLRFANHEVATRGDLFRIYYYLESSDRLFKITDGSIQDSTG